MALLATKLADPTTAQLIPLTAAAAGMAAISTTFLRNVFTVPANGTVLVRQVATIHGAVTSPSIFLGVMEGSVVRGRVAPNMVWAGAQAATSFVSAEALFTVPGLTPGQSLTWDAAFGVETGVAGSNIKFGGPNDTTANNGFGAYIFEIWST